MTTLDRNVLNTLLRNATCGTLRSEDIGRQVTLYGWVSRRREHGEHLAFVDLRDATGLVQCVIDGQQDARSEWVIRVQGTVRARPEGTVNESLPTGMIEIGDCTVEVVNEATPPPFPLNDRVEVDETTRLRYRYLDLRRDQMKHNLRVRATVNSALRLVMEAMGFLEVETPLLIASTPEGARDFLVPSRHQPGRAYALPQSPQILKQLCMVGGLDRYYQIARCLRDEDLRADRQYEFTQLDVEASFVTQEDVFAMVGEAVLHAVEQVTGSRPVDVIPQMTWRHAMDRYGSDKPDVRFGLQLVDVGDVFSTTEAKVLQAPCVMAIRVPDGAEMGRSRIDALTELAKKRGAKGLAWMKVTEGPKLEGGLSKFVSESELPPLLKRTEAEVGDLLLMVADEWRVACEVLGVIRLELGRPPISEGGVNLLWITEFPMFDGVADDGTPQAAHHPFTMPVAEDLELLETDPLRVRSQSYDLVCNGWELGSGSIRIHRADIQARVFDALRITEEEQKAKFGFLLDAFQYGAPPHGGFAVGIDRLVAILCGEENIRDVIAYPKTQSGADLLMDAPTPIDPKALKELGLQLLPKK